MRITIRIDNIEYDTSTASMRIKGVNVRESKYMALGQSHTVDLGLNRAFSIHKDKWDAMDVERISIAADPSKSADLAVVVMEHGLAHLCLITSEMTLTKVRAITMFLFWIQSIVSLSVRWTGSNRKINSPKTYSD